MKNAYRSVILLLLAGSITFMSCTRQPQQSSTAPQESAAPESGADQPAQPVSVNEAIIPPQFSAEGGFYADAVSLTLTAESGTEIYYTLDGSAPTTQSLRYTEPIPLVNRTGEKNILSAHTEIAPEGSYTQRVAAPDAPVDKAAVVRAIAVNEQGEQSLASAQTYFIGLDEKYRNGTVVSLLTDESSLFDYDTGIYVLGKTYNEWKNSADYDAETPPWRTPANYTQKGKEWERPASVQIFADGKPVLTQDAGIRIHGGATRSYAQKSLNVYARRDYGASKLEYDLFGGKVTAEYSGEPVTVFDSFILRNGGNDAQYTRFRDKLNQSLVSGRHFLTQGMTPCTVFIDGEYWGQYEITEKLDAAFIRAHYGIPKKQVCIVKKEALDAGSEACFAQWEQLRAEIQKADLSDPDAYADICAQIDMQGFMEYISSEIYMNNANWGASNSAMWKAELPDPENPYADGKWRFIMFDTEYSTGIYGEAQPREDTFAKLLDSGCFLGALFSAALKNETFRQDFTRTFREIAEQDFDAARVDAEITALAEAYRQPAVDTYNRFWCTGPGGRRAEQNFDAEVQKLRRFYEKRGAYILEYLEKHCGE
ncbi:MAG: CotH kinase family protein [Oscillospiraceae bacterium]|nr:CotH kinase family protein [Oscillospiraceae bacterium]